MIVLLLSAVVLSTNMEVDANGAASKPYRRYQPADLKGATVLITGATAGIGEACAWRFAEAGCKLIVTGRRLARLEVLKNDILKEFPSLQIHAARLDMQELEDIKAFPGNLPHELQQKSHTVRNSEGSACPRPAITAVNAS